MKTGTFIGECMASYHFHPKDLDYKSSGTNSLTASKTRNKQHTTNKRWSMHRQYSETFHFEEQGVSTE